MYLVLSDTATVALSLAVALITAAWLYTRARRARG